MTKLLKNQAGVAHVAALMAVVLVVAVGGVGWSVYNSSKKSTKNSTSSQTETEVKDTLPAGFVPTVTIEQVRETAAKEAPDQAVLGIQLEVEEGKVVYSVRLANGKKLVIDATTGVLVTKGDAVKSDDDSDESMPKDFTPAVSSATARSTAEGKFPGKTVKAIELETEEGVVVWSVRFTDGSRVDVNATNGSVVRTREGKSGSSKTNTTTTQQKSNSENETENETETHNSTSSGGNSSSNETETENHQSGGGSGSGSGGGSGSHDSNDD